MRDKQYFIFVVLLIVILHNGRAWTQTVETNVNICNSKVVEVNEPDGSSKYYWFEAKCDPLIRKYILKEIELSEYILTGMGSKSPNAPDVILSIKDNMPGKEIPCWNISAARIIDDYLWISLIPIRQPRITQYISMPPHPHGVRPGGNPYEGGIIRIELKTSKWTRWTSLAGLPTEMVCREVEGLPEKIIFGNVITQIQKNKDKIIFKSRNQSEMQFDIEQGKFKCIHSEEPNTLIALLKDGKTYYNYIVTSYAVERLGQLHSIEAIPLLVEILSSHPDTAGTDCRYEAKNALIEINSRLALDKLKILVDSEDERTREYSREVIDFITK
jgi:hypothetical protein